MKQAKVAEEPTQALTVRAPAGEVGAALPPEEIHRPQVTAAQAKIDAVASLTMKAYDKAATLQITPEEAARLAADFPDEAFKPGAAGKEHLIYIEHAYLRDRLSSVFGIGQWAIVPRNRWAEEFTTQKGTPGTRVYVEAMLVIRGAFVAEAIGSMEYYPKNESQDYSDAVEGAKTAALRRCAKELGVGLQAWKKDWCEGWWERFRAKRKGWGAGKPTPMAQRQTATAPAQPTPPPAQSTVKPVQAPVYATDKTRDWFLGQIEQKGLTTIAEEFYRKVENPSVLMPNETLKDLPLQFVPVTRDMFNLSIAAFTDFANGDKPVHPFPANPQPHRAEPPPPPPPPPQPAPTQPPRHDPEAWRDIIVPIPPRGVKKAEYMKEPDTIGSLYDQCKDGNDPSCKRLWGFVNHFEPKPWVGHDGVQRPASQSDKLFRSALDEFAAWHEKNGHKSEPRQDRSEPKGQSAQDAIDRDTNLEDAESDERSPFD